MAFDIVFDLVMRDLGEVVPAQSEEERENAVRRTEAQISNLNRQMILVFWAQGAKSGPFHVTPCELKSPDRHNVPFK